MSTETSFLPEYFANYQKTLPRRLASASASFGLWTRRSRSLRTKSSNSSVNERVTDMEPPINGTNGNGIHNDSTPPPNEPTVAFFDPEIFRSYLLALLPPVIGALPSDLEDLFDHEFDERVTRFAGEGGGVLYVVKSKDEVEGKLLVLFTSNVD